MHLFILFILVSISICMGAFAQGKISMLNDSSRLVYFGASVKPADAAYVGQPVPAGPLPSGAILLVDLYGGTNADNMTLQQTTTMSASGAGLFGPVSSISPNLPGGQTATMRIKVRESTFPTTEASQAGGGYWGYSQIFTFKPGATIAYNSIINQGGTTLSTWSNGATIEVKIGLGELGPPVFYAQPSSGSYVLGTNVTLSAGAVGDSPLSYQWRKNDSSVNGATNISLTLTNLALSDAGSYELVVTNPWGTATSSNAVFQVLPPNAPSIRVNDVLAVGTVIVAGSAAITLAGGFPGGFFFYTLDGTTPTTSSTLYSGASVITATATLRAMSLSADFTQSSEAPAVNVVLPPLYSLVTSTVGSGTIGNNPAPGPYVSNSVVTLTANAAAHWAFDHWSGDLSGNENPTNLTMSGQKSVQAVFVPTAFPLTLSAPGGGSVTADGLTIGANTYYPTGSVVQLQATPNSAWTFLNWLGTVTGTANPFNLTMSQTQNVQAVFGTLVAINIAGNGSVALSATNPVAYGTVLTNTAVPAPGYRFVTWSGAASGTNNPVTFTVTSATPTVGALFALLPATGGQLKNPRKIGPDFVCDLDGTPSRNYQILYSANLADWSELVILTNMNGTASFTNSMGDTKQYYRARLLP